MEFVVNGGTFSCTSIGGDRSGRDIDSHGSFVVNGGTVTCEQMSGSAAKNWSVSVNGGKVNFTRSMTAVNASKVLFSWGDKAKLGVAGKISAVIESDLHGGEPGALVFDGPGTLLLKKGLYHSGVSVDGGWLVVEKPVLNGMSDVSVADNAKLKLDYDGTVDVRTVMTGEDVGTRDRKYGASFKKRAYFAGAGAIRPREGVNPPGMSLFIR